jgi:hypothetical protein
MPYASGGTAPDKNPTIAVLIDLAPARDSPILQASQFIEQLSDPSCLALAFGALHDR